MDSLAPAHSPQQMQIEEAQSRGGLLSAFGFHVFAILLGIALALM
jgi:hypothetical protein